MSQAEWRPRPDGATVSLDVLAPRHEARFTRIGAFGPNYAYQASRLFSAHLLSARVPLGAGVAVQAELPIVYRDYDISAEEAARLQEIEQRHPGTPIGEELSQTYTQFAIGNAMIGVDVALGAHLHLDAGLRVPVRRSPAVSSLGLRYIAPEVVGRVADGDRPEVYKTGATTLALGIGGSRPLRPGLTVEGRIGPVLSILDRGLDTTLDGEPDTPVSNVATPWHAILRQRLGPASLGAGVVSRFQPRAGWGTPKSGDPLSALLQVRLDGATIRPGLQYKVGVAGTGAAGPTFAFSLDVALD